MVSKLVEMKYFSRYSYGINLHKVCVIYLLLKIFDIWDNDLGQRTNGNRPPLGGKISGK